MHQYNKLKLFHSGPTTYAQRKKIGIDCVKKLIIANKWDTGFEKHKKKDDLADTLLQLIWYLNNINYNHKDWKAMVNITKNLKKLGKVNLDEATEQPVVKN